MKQITQQIQLSDTSLSDLRLSNWNLGDFPVFSGLQAVIDGFSCLFAMLQTAGRIAIILICLWLIFRFVENHRILRKKRKFATKELDHCVLARYKTSVMDFSTRKLEGE